MKYNQKLCIKKVTDRGKGSKTMNEIKLVKNISKNLQSFLEESVVQKEVLHSNKLRDHAYSKFEWRHQIYINLSFREFNSQLSSSNSFDNMAIVHWAKIC